jgi:hypothetical protein
MENRTQIQEMHRSMCCVQGSKLKGGTFAKNPTNFSSSSNVYGKRQDTNYLAPFLTQPKLCLFQTGTRH